MEDEQVTARELRVIDRVAEKALSAILAVQLVVETMVKVVPRVPRFDDG